MIDYARANNGPNSSYHNSVLFVEITLKAKTLTTPVPPLPATTPAPPPGATIPPPACGVCQEEFGDDADELPCCKARVCNACAREVAAIVTCPFCGGDPSPVVEDCSNDAAIALALSRGWA